MKYKIKVEYKIGIVVAKFNKEITEKMKDYALNYAKQSGVAVTQIIEVPGSFEIPFGVQILLEKDEIKGVITLGAIIKGDTEHDKVIAYAIANKIADLSLTYKKPVSLGIIGPDATWQQALKRRKEYAERSVQAVTDMLDILFE